MPRSAVLYPAVARKNHHHGTEGTERCRRRRWSETQARARRAPGHQRGGRQQQLQGRVHAPAACLLSERDPLPAASSPAPVPDGSGTTRLCARRSPVETCQRATVDGNQQRQQQRDRRAERAATSSTSTGSSSSGSEELRQRGNLRRRRGKGRGGGGRRRG